MSKQFDLEEFRKFVASKPADETYPRLAASKCALAQFGFPNVGRSDLKRLCIPAFVYDAAVHGPRRDGSSTFGALLDRLTK